MDTLYRDVSAVGRHLVILEFNFVTIFATWLAWEPCLILIFDGRSGSVTLGLRRTDWMVPGWRVPVGGDLPTAVCCCVARVDITSVAFPIVRLLFWTYGVPTWRPGRTGLPYPTLPY